MWLNDTHTRSLRNTHTHTHFCTMVPDGMPQHSQVANWTIPPRGYHGDTHTRTHAHTHKPPCHWLSEVCARSIPPYTYKDVCLSNTNWQAAGYNARTRYTMCSIALDSSTAPLCAKTPVVMVAKCSLTLHHWAHGLPFWGGAGVHRVTCKSSSNSLL